MIVTFFTGENFKFILVEFLKNKLYFRAISDLQNSCEYSRESPYSPPCFLLLLTPYISVAHFHNNGILLWLRIYILFRFLSFFFYLMCLFSSRIPCRIPHYINCHISLGWQILRVPVFLMSLRGYWLGMSLIWGVCLKFFSWFSYGDEFWGVRLERWSTVFTTYHPYDLSLLMLILIAWLT